MRYFLCSVWAFLLVVPLALADVTISLPKTAQGDIGDFVTIPSTTTGSVVKWYSVDSNLRLFPPSLLKDTKTAIVIGKTAGKYTLLAWTSDNSGPSDAASCVVQIGQPTPPPPPTPPVNTLTQAIQTIYSSDANANKATKKNSLQALYYLAGKSLVNNQSLATAQDLYNAVEAARLRLMAQSDMEGEQGIIVSYLLSKYPATQALDAATRSKMAADFATIANDLGDVK